MALQLSLLTRQFKCCQMFHVKENNSNSFNLLKKKMFLLIYLIISSRIFSQILPQFLVSTPRYILPHRDGKGSVVSRESDQVNLNNLFFLFFNIKKSFNTLSAFVHAMLKKGVVALCRYAYNVTSNPRLACLIPKITKKENYPVRLIKFL